MYFNVTKYINMQYFITFYITILCIATIGSNIQSLVILRIHLAIEIII